MLYEKAIDWYCSFSGYRKKKLLDAAGIYGFLFTGGHDVSPSVYQSHRSEKCGECCIQRDEMETALFRKAFEIDKPILGICRGIQFINAIMGGTLYQDLPTQYSSETEHHQLPPYDVPCHGVKIMEDSQLFGQCSGIRNFLIM